MATVLRPSIAGGRKLRDVAAVLRAQSKALPRGLAKAIKDEGRPTLDDLKAAARSVKVTGVRTNVKARHGPTAPKRLRERMAAATVLEVRTSEREQRVSFHVDSSRMGNAKVIPRYIDLGPRAGRAGWRHPVFGDREVWATSIGQPWFFKPIKRHLPEFRKRIDAVLDEVRVKVEES